MDRLEMLFVYQSRNFHEMVAFTEWGRSLGCDLIVFQRLHFLPGSGYSAGDVDRRSIQKPEHPQNSEFTAVLKELERFPGLVTIDNNYGININTSNYSDLLLSQ
jgi:hypothetical protein